MELDGTSKGLRAGQLPPLLGVEEACKLLGISRYAGYQAARTGELPTLRLGRRLFVPTAKLLNLIGLSTGDAA